MCGTRSESRPRDSTSPNRTTYSPLLQLIDSHAPLSAPPIPEFHTPLRSNCTRKSIKTPPSPLHTQHSKTNDPRHVLPLNLPLWRIPKRNPRLQARPWDSICHCQVPFPSTVATHRAQMAESKLHMIPSSRGSKLQKLTQLRGYGIPQHGTDQERMRHQRRRAQRRKEHGGERRVASQRSE